MMVMDCPGIHSKFGNQSCGSGFCKFFPLLIQDRGSSMKPTYLQNWFVSVACFCHMGLTLAYILRVHFPLCWYYIGKTSWFGENYYPGLYQGGRQLSIADKEIVSHWYSHHQAAFLQGQVPSSVNCSEEAHGCFSVVIHPCLICPKVLQPARFPKHISFPFLQLLTCIYYAVSVFGIILKWKTAEVLEYGTS